MADTFAQTAYEAYADSVRWLNHLGRPMPVWSDLPDAIRTAWADAAAAVIERLKGAEDG